MQRPFILNAANGTQVFPLIPNGQTGPQQISITWGIYPTAGAALVEYLPIGSNVWTAVAGASALDVTVPQTVSLTATVAQYRVTLSSLVGGVQGSFAVADTGTGVGSTNNLPATPTGSPPEFQNSSTVTAIGFEQIKTTGYRRNARTRNTIRDLIPVPAWTAGETITVPSTTGPRVRQIKRRLTSGQVLLAVASTGVTGVTEPVFSVTGSIIDNQVTWVADGTISSAAAAPFAVPAVSAFNGALPGGYTEYQCIIGVSGANTGTNNTDRFLEVGQIVIPYQPTLNGGPQGAGASQCYSYNYGGSTDGAGFNFNPGGVLMTGIDCKQRIIHFLSESASIIIGFWATGGTRNYLLRMRKAGTNDWYRVEGSPTLSAAVGSQFAGIRLNNFNPQRDMFEYQVICGADMPFRGVAVEASASVRAPVQSGVYLQIYGDSYWDTVSSYESAPWDVGGLRFAWAFGADYLRQMNKGGTGFLNTGTGTGSPFYTVGQMIANNVRSGDVPHYAVIGGLYNDASLYAADPTGSRAIIKAALTNALALYPTTEWMVLDPWAGCEDPGGVSQTTKGGQLIVLATALQSIVAEIANPRLHYVRYVSKPGGSFTNGVGAWGALTGVGNADMKQGADKTHHSPAGRQIDFGGVVANECDVVMAAVGR